MNLLAYIDPGAGSLLIQAVIAAVLVIPFFLRSQIRRGIDRLTGRSSRCEASSSATSPEEARPPDQN